MLARGASQKKCSHSAGVSCRETSGYRARDPRGDVLNRIVTDTLSEFTPGADGRLCYTPVRFPTEAELAAITEAVRRKVIRRLGKIGGLCAEAAEQMLSWKNSGFSIHEKVRIKANDKEGREHLILP